MRNTVLRMYHTLEEESMYNQVLNFQYGTPEFSFSKMGIDWNMLKLTRKINDSMHCEYIVENDEQWDPDICMCKIRQEITIDNLDKLFAKSNTDDDTIKVALPTDELGVAVIWWSDKSDIRGCKELYSFNLVVAQRQPKKRIMCELNFQDGILSGRLQLQYILFLRKPGTAKRAGFTHTQGSKLGDIGIPIGFHIDGDASAFPVSIAEVPGKPLWWVEFNIENPFYDRFDRDYVNLILNQSHPDFKDLGKGKGYRTALSREIFAAALESFLYKMYDEFREELTNIDRSQLIPGTVAYAYSYMKDFLNIQMDTKESIHDTVRKMINNKLNAGGQR